MRLVATSTWQRFNMFCELNVNGRFQPAVPPLCVRLETWTTVQVSFGPIAASVTNHAGPERLLLLPSSLSPFSHSLSPPAYLHQYVINTVLVFDVPTLKTTKQDRTHCLVHKSVTLIKEAGDAAPDHRSLRRMKPRGSLARCWRGKHGQTPIRWRGGDMRALSLRLRDAHITECVCSMGSTRRRGGLSLTWRT